MVTVKITVEQDLGSFDWEVLWGARSWMGWRKMQRHSRGAQRHSRREEGRTRPGWVQATACLTLVTGSAFRGQVFNPRRKSWPHSALSISSYTRALKLSHRTQRLVNPRWQPPKGWCQGFQSACGSSIKQLANTPKIPHPPRNKPSGLDFVMCDFKQMKL